VTHIQLLITNEIPAGTVSRRCMLGACYPSACCVCSQKHCSDLTLTAPRVDGAGGEWPSRQSLLLPAYGCIAGGVTCLFGLLLQGQPCMQPNTSNQIHMHVPACKASVAMSFAPLHEWNLRSCRVSCRWCRPIRTASSNEWGLDFTEDQMSSPARWAPAAAGPHVR